MSKTKFNQMKIYRAWLRYVLIVFTGAALLISCEEDYETNADDSSILLTYPDQQIKAPGHGQYRLKALSGEKTEVIANLESILPLNSLTITKTVNLVIDPEYANNGVLTVDANAINTDYVFQYTPLERDIDQLVGFIFEAVGSNGTRMTSDLQLVVTLSPRDNLPRRKWLWKSKIHVDAGNVQDIKECEKDNYYLFNSDGTMSLNFGANTGTPGCDFDGFNVYDSWSLSEDGKEFIMIYHSIFSPDSPQIEKYRVKTLTTEKLEVEIDYDLSWLGLSTEETFLFEFTATPK
jgi:hypothetical protein